jgi:membrane-bound serine protease (ClpP class)
MAAAALIVLEAKFSSHGVLALAGTLSLVFGLATLVDGPIPEQRVHTSTAVTLGLAFGIISFFLAFIALRARRNKVLTGPQAMVGGIAEVRSSFDPIAQVEIRGEIWQARLLNPAAAPRPALGSTVRVCAVEDLVLIVEP